jgi:hypothetical protein
MKSRRLLALLTSVAMLHLSVVAGDAACATHGGATHHGATAGMETTSHLMRTADHVERSAVSSDDFTATRTLPPCEIPTQAHCCDALAGCGISGALAQVGDGADAAITAAVRMRVAPDDAPASFAPAPEPPPPKA